MIHLYKKTFLALLLGGGLTAQGQISNEGTLSITENTTLVFFNDFSNTASGMLSNNGEVHIKQNLINNGGFTFDDLLSNESITHFSGNTIQHISGSELLEIPRLQLNNALGYQLAAHILVGKQVNFTNGIIHNQAFGGEISFEPNANHNNANNQSYVDGMVLKTGGENFIFPIGANEQYHALSLSNNRSSSSLFSAQYFAENSNDSYPHNQKDAVIEIIAETEYWNLEQIQGTSSA
ncbi:MAG: hypothetical protein JKX82_00440, partial [Oleispira sp.]|nr:hypothetical protein [Oleispira sp.]